MEQSTSNFFKSFEEVESYIESLKKENNPLRVYSSQLVESYNAKLKNVSYHLPLNVKYSKIRYVCKHYGTFKSRGKAVQQTKSVLPCDCKYSITLKYDKNLGGFIITSRVDLHNHEIGPELFAHYAENRKLGIEEKEQVMEMFRAGAKPSLVSKIMQEKTTKVVLTKDLHNIKQMHKDKKSEIHKLVEVGEEFLKNLPGSEFILGIDENKEYLEVVFIQTSHQKKMYAAFGEVLELDATYRTTNSGMPLFDFVVEDSDGKSVVVAYCFLPNETAASIGVMLDIFKKANSAFEDTNVILIDKDFAEINAVKAAFPKSKVFLCLFHMFKSINGKLNSLRVVEKEKAVHLCRKIANTSNPEEIDNLLVELRVISEDFYKYFESKWLSCKETWCSAFQKGLMTLMNRTTNRVEANHRQLKDHLSSLTSITEAVKLLLTLSSTAYTDISHRQFRNTVLTTVSLNQHEDLVSYFAICTPYAAELISFEHTASLKNQYSIINNNGEHQIVTSYHIHAISNDKKNCVCDFNVRMALSCRHLFYLRRHLNLPPFDDSMVSNRFKRNYLSEISFDKSQVSTEFPAIKTFTNPKSESKKFSRSEKFKKALLLSHKISEAVSELADKDFHIAMKNLEIVLKCFQNKEGVEIASVSKNITMIDEHSYSKQLMPDQSVSNEVIIDSIEEEVSEQEIVSLGSVPEEGAFENVETSESPNIDVDKSLGNKVTLNSDLLNVKVKKIKCKGRPSQQRSSSTYLAKRRRMDKKLTKSVANFDRKPCIQKQMLMMSWFTTKEVSLKALGGKLIEEEDVECIPQNIPDGCIDTKVSWMDIKKFFTADAWLAVENAVQAKKIANVFKCGSCRKTLSGDCNSIACESCLSWFCWSCQNILSEPDKKSDWFCKNCINDMTK